MCRSHKYQGGVQIVVIFLHEFSVILGGLLLVMFVKFGTEVALLCDRTLLLSLGEI